MIAIPTLLILGAWHFLDLETFFKEAFKQKISPPHQTEEQEEQEEPKTQLSKTGLKGLILETNFLNADQDVFFVETQDKRYTITTSLDPGLQKMLLSAMNRLKTLGRGKPQRIAIVAMDPMDGSLKGMAGFDLDNAKANPCTVSDYPAASIVKIITASAAIDSLGYTAHTPLYFNGNKYT